MAAPVHVPLVIKFLVVIVGFSVHVVELKTQQTEFTMGKIKAFDDILRMYGGAINSAGKELKYAVQEAKRLATNPEYNPEFSRYYIEILELLESTGDAKVLNQEKERLNVILTSASNQPGAEGELDYAKMRRNILISFIDAAADHVMSQMFDFPGDFPGDSFGKPVADGEHIFAKTKQEPIIKEEI